MSTQPEAANDETAEADSAPGLTGKQQRETQASDIRNGRIEPAYSERFWISGFNEWGWEEEMW